MPNDRQAATAVNEEQRAQTLYFGGLGADMLRLLAWTGVLVALLRLPVSRKLERQRERSAAAGAFRPPNRRFARET